MPWCHLVGSNHFRKLMALHRSSAEAAATKGFVSARFAQAESTVQTVRLEVVFPYLSTNIKTWLRQPSKASPEGESAPLIQRVLQVGLARWITAREALSEKSLTLFDQR